MNNSHQTYITQTNVPDPLPTQHSPLSSLFCCSTSSSSSEEEAKPQSIDRSIHKSLWEACGLWDRKVGTQ